jgi:mannose-6-phosphate isomerase-like protein (cupin superfamily)
MSEGIVIRRFEDADERREFELGFFELLTAGGVELGRASYEPGWRWSTHVGPTAGTELCEVAHVGVVLSGRAAVEMRDGTLVEMGAGDVFVVPPGHDSWVIGDEPYVSLHLVGAGAYATAEPQSDQA